MFFKEPVRVGYILKMFPRLSETFILNELLELEREGASINIFSSTDPFNSKPYLVHDELIKELKAPVIYLTPKQMLKRWKIRRVQFREGVSVEKRWKEAVGSDASETYINQIRGFLVASMARSLGITHLHAHFGTEAASVALHASRLVGIPFSFTAHAKDIYHKTYNIDHLREKILGAKFVVTVSDYNRQYLMKLVGKRQARKIIRIYNGIDLKRFGYDIRKHQDPSLILSVGRLIQKKGFTYLIQACSILKKRGFNCKCYIIGDGPLKESLELEINALGLQSSVKLLGPKSQEHVFEILKTASIFVLPSIIDEFGDRDALPTVLLEAHAMGLPVISTNISGIPEIVDNGKTGFLVQPKDPISLAKKIEKVLSNHQLGTSLGQNGRKKVEALFDIRKNLPTLRKLFTESSSNQEYSLGAASR